MIGSLVNNKKRFALVVILALTMALIVALPAMATDTSLSITSPVIGENEINMVTAGTDVTMEATDLDEEGAMYSFWFCDATGWSLSQESASNTYTIHNMQPGTYTIDVYCWNATGDLANARQSILVDSGVVFTGMSYKDGSITLTAMASNISGAPDYQFWCKDSEGWKCVKDYDSDNTATFEATAGETYEVAVYAKDVNGTRHWKHAAAASGSIEAVEAAEGLRVTSVSVVNTSTIKVSFSKAVDAVSAANFSLSNGTLKAVALSPDKTEATLSIEGLSYGDKVTVTVADVIAGDEKITSYNQEAIIPAFGEFYKVELSAGDDVILADGLSKTMISAKIIDRATNKPVIVDGLVTFTTTKGDFAQPQVSFDQTGVAALQLTSEVSTRTINAFITATVTSVPGATEYEGLVGQYQVRFAPADEIDEELQMVTMISASSSQADRINVVFSGKVTKDEIVASYPGLTNAAKLLAARADSFGFRVDGATAVLDVRNINEKTLELILDVDSPVVTPELRWNSNNGDFEWYDWRADITYKTATNDPGCGFLRDNMKHNISIPVNIANMVANPYDAAKRSGGVEFILTDISKPWIAGVDAEDQITLIVRFSEAMARDITEEMTAGIYDNFRIDGKRLMQSVLPLTDAQKTLARNNNYLIVDSLTVQPYDERHIVVIRINPWNKLAAGEYALQASNVGDWAAMTHSANMLETQTFDFTVEVDTRVPTAKIERQSPEQWLIEFNMPVKLADVKSDGVTKVELEEAIKIYSKDERAKGAEGIPFTLTNALAPVDHYQVTAINQNGRLVGGTADGYNPKATDAAVTNVRWLLIEFKKDWTVIYDTDQTKVNYFDSRKNSYTVVLNNWVSEGAEIPMATHELKVELVLDAESPTIVNATDMYEIDRALYPNTGRAVFVEMSEPVQLRNSGDTVVTTPLTESQQQAAGVGIPIPTFEFVKGDTVIPGSILPGSIPQNDYSFIVRPDSTLTAGTWKLIIRSISDDVGNTSATVTRDFVVEGAVAAVTDTRVAWVGFDNAGTDNDYVYVKFTKVMKSTGANGVSRTTNFTLNNNPLPQGSEIIKGIKDLENVGAGNVTNDWDGLTVKMPRTAWDGTPEKLLDIDFTMIFGVASNFEANDGEKLIGPYTVQLNDTANGVGPWTDADFDFEAVYVNNRSASNLIDEQAVVRAEAYDTDANGKVDQIRLYTCDGAATQIASLPLHQIKVNGVTFASNGTNYNAVSSQVNGTATTDLVITSTIGAIIVNEGNVVDNAAPVIAKAQLNKEKTKITLTFSEPVSAAMAGAPFKGLEANDFTIALTGGQTITDVEHKAGKANQAVLTLSAAAKTAETTDIIALKAGAAYDASDNAASTNKAAKLEGALDTGIVNKAALNAKITEAEALAAADYTVASWAALQTTLTNAKATEADAQATQAQVDAATTALDNAIQALETVTVAPDNTALNAKIAEVEALAAADYTAASWAALQTALNAAKDVAADAQATQAQIDAALAELNAKKDALVTVGPAEVTAQDLNVVIDTLLPGVFNATIPFADAQAGIGATTESTLVLAVQGKDSLELVYNAAVLDNAGGFLKAAVQGYTEAEIEAAIVTVKAPPAVVTAQELNVVIDILLPGVFNATIPFADAQAGLGATTESTLVLAVQGKDSLELVYNAAVLDNAGGFLKAAVQGYTEAEIEGGVVTLK